MQLTLLLDSFDSMSDLCSNYHVFCFIFVRHRHFRQLTFQLLQVLLTSMLCQWCSLLGATFTWLPEIFSLFQCSFGTGCDSIKSLTYSGFRPVLTWCGFVCLSNKLSYQLGSFYAGHWEPPCHPQAACIPSWFERPYLLWRHKCIFSHHQHSVVSVAIPLWQYCIFRCKSLNVLIHSVFSGWG